MPRKSLLQSRSHGVTPSSQVQVRLRQGTAVVVVVEEVIVVVVVLSQTVPAPHTPEQQSKPERQPWSPSGIQPTHMPVVVSQSDMAQVPQLPPQPSSPQFLPAQSGVQAVVVVVEVVVVVVVVLVGVPQTPKSGFAFPGGGLGFMQFPLQQLMLVAHRWPSGLQPSARTLRGQPPSSAMRATSATRSSENRPNHVVGAE